MSDVIITVRGEHETRVAPEEGVVQLSLRCDGPARGSVIERIAVLSAPVREELTVRRDCGEVSEWSSQRASVWAERPWNNEGVQLPLVHHAVLDVAATFTDFAALSQWVSSVAEREGVHVDAVTWDLTAATRRAVEAEVSAHAVKTALSRANAYAQAISRTSITPLEIADIGLLGRADADPAARMMRAVATGPSPALDFHPRDITVTAGVEARFVAR